MTGDIARYKVGRDFMKRNGLIDDRLPVIQHIRKARDALDGASDPEAFWRLLSLEYSAVINAVWQTLEKAGINKQDGKELHEVIEELLGASSRA